MRYAFTAVCLFSVISTLACSSSSTAIGPSGAFASSADKLPKGPLPSRDLSQGTLRIARFSGWKRRPSPALSHSIRWNVLQPTSRRPMAAEWRAVSNEAWIIVSDEGKDAQHGSGEGDSSPAAPNHEGFARTRIRVRRRAQSTCSPTIGSIKGHRGRCPDSRLPSRRRRRSRHSRSTHEFSRIIRVSPGEVRGLGRIPRPCVTERDGAVEDEAPGRESGSTQK